MSSIHIAARPNAYLPAFPTSYFDPRITKREIGRMKEERKKKIDEAIEYIGNLEVTQRKVREKSWCLTNCNNTVCNLAAYLVSQPCKIFARAFCCCFIRPDKKQKPIPEEAAKTLALTTVQFERNVIGVCCIAPAVIIATPYIPVAAAGEKLLSILSGLVITTTAGTNTYVFSGDIGVVDDGRNKRTVQGGIRVDAITVIKNAYISMAEHLQTEWDLAESTRSDERKKKLGLQCQKIREKWSELFDRIADCGLKTSAVKEVLEPLSISIREILDSYEEGAKLEIVVDQKEKKAEASAYVEMPLPPARLVVHEDPTS